MYGVPADLDLTRFIGTTLEQICIGQFQINFHFCDPDTSISVGGRWVLAGPDGVVVDESRENSQRDAYRIHALLEKRVVATSIDPPRSFTLRFETGHHLSVLDDSPQYESFSIQPGDIVV